MKLRSLRVRLLLGAAVAIFVALAAAWFAMTLLFERHIERRAEADLVRNGMQLAADIAVGADGLPVLNGEPGDARFAEPASGMYWQVVTRAGSLRSRSLWDESLPASDVAKARDWSTRFIRGPFGQELLLVERIVRPEQGGSDVLLQFLIEAVILSSMGGILGILLGVGSSQLISKLNNWPVLVSTSSVIVAFVFSAAVGMIFGFLPARKAAQLDPIDALRYE